MKGMWPIPACVDVIANGEAAQRPTVHYIDVKTVEQQDIQCLIRARELLVKERTALTNQIRGFLAEYGVIVTKGISHLRLGIPYILEDAENELSIPLRRLLGRQHTRMFQLDTDIEKITNEMTTLVSHHRSFHTLLTIPGVGPIVASMILAALNDTQEFKKGRQFAAWLGLTPVQYSSGSMNRLGRISLKMVRNYYLLNFVYVLPVIGVSTKNYEELVYEYSSSFKQ